jgi:hypothetical protein
LFVVGTAPAFAQSVEGVDLPRHDTKYYVLHTDLTGDALREVELRITKMSEEYRARTRGFFGAADRKLPFYLFRNAQDYFATGMPEESAGAFTGSALLALAGEKPDLHTWHTIQHEGFHQYVHAVIGPNLPIWLNEGMAEYFGEGLFTGEGFETGLVPQWRLDRVRKSILAGDFVSLRDMMRLPTEEWNAKLSVNNYDQAWSMVQFLAHGDGGRYERAFVRFISDVGRGKQWPLAWKDSFGGDTDGFERRWKDYWSNLPDNPTGTAYGRVAVQILTGFLGRAHAQRQRFETFADFAKALRDETVRVSNADWLPSSLGKDGAGLAKALGTWTIDPGLKSQPPRLILDMKDGTRVVGTFATNRDGRVAQVRADVQASRAARGPATSRPARYRVTGGR